MDFKVCRICGCVEGLKNIIDQGTDMMDKLLVCTNIKICPGDVSPKLICEQCEQNVDLSYCLRKQSEATQNRLRWEIKVKKNEHIRNAQESSDSENLFSKGYEDISNYQKKIQSQDFKECAKINIADNCILGEDSSNHMNYINKYVENREQIFLFKTEDVENNVAMDIPSQKLEDIAERASCKTNNKIRNEENEMLEEMVIVSSVLADNDGNIYTNEHNYENKKLNKSIEKPLVNEHYSIDLLSSPSGSTSDRCHEVEFRDVDTLTCNTCQEVFSKKKDYSIHIKQHGNERYQCIQCCKFFPTRFRLMRHEEIHVEVPTHECPYCNRSYRVLCNLNRHIRSVHLLKNTLQCKICHVSYSRVDVLKRHLQLHSEEKNYKCLLCCQSFKTKDYLYAHSKIHRTDSSAISKTYKGSKAGNANKNQCGHCGKMFKSSFAYKNHLLIHTNEKPYKCESCNKMFRTVAALKTHQRIHDGQRPYQCDICLKGFKQSAHLNEHKRLHFDNVPQHMCSICQAPFAKKGNLKTHLRIHTKEKPFKCPHCSAEFSYMHLLQRHASKVHNRSTHKVYTTNVTVETVEQDDSTKSNGTIESVLYGYIDTEIEEDSDRNVIDDHVIHESTSPRTHIINDEPAIKQLIFNDENCTLDSEPIVDFIQIHSLNSIQSQSLGADSTDGIDDYDNCQ